MKKLICVVSTLSILPFYSSGTNSLKQIFDYPSFTAEEKLNFNNHPQPGEALSFKGQNLDFLNISGIKLWGTNFEGVTLNGTNFFKADLTGCNFKGAILKNVNFQEAILINTDFTGAHFKDVKLQGAKLTETLTLPYYSETVEILKLYSDLQNEVDKNILNNLIGTGAFTFRYQEIKNLNLRGINFKNCKFVNTKIMDCDLTDAKFINNDLITLSFFNIKFSDTFILKGKVDLYNLYKNPILPQEHKNILAKMFFTQINLSETTLFDDFIIPSYKDHKDLVKRYVDFPAERENLNKLFDIISLNLSGADLKNLNLQGLNFSKANLRRARLQGSILFEGFKVPDYRIDKDLIMFYINSQDPQERENLNKLFDIYPLDLIDSDLKNLDLRGINLSKANLKDAQLQGAILFDDFKVPEYYNRNNTYLSQSSNKPNSLVEIYGKSTDPILRENLNKLFDIFPIELNDFHLGSSNCKGLNLEGLNLKNITFEKNINFSGIILFEGFTVSDYRTGTDLIKIYSNSKDPKFRRNLNRLFSICPLKLSRSGIYTRGNGEYDPKGYNRINVNLVNLDLEGINLMKNECRDVDFLDCNLTNSIYDEDDSSSLKSANLKRVQLSEGFIFSSDLSKKDLEVMYTKIAKTDKQKYLFKSACKLSYGYLFNQINFSDTSN